MSMLLLILIFTYTIFTYTVCHINKSLGREQSVIVLEFGFLFFLLNHYYFYNKLPKLLISLVFKLFPVHND